MKKKFETNTKIIDATCNVKIDTRQGGKWQKLHGSCTVAHDINSPSIRFGKNKVHIKTSDGRKFKMLRTDYAMIVISGSAIIGDSTADITDR